MLLNIFSTNETYTSNVYMFVYFTPLLKLKMNPTIYYFLRLARTHIVPVILMVVIPVAVPFLVNLLLTPFVTNINDIKTTPYSLPLLPQPDKVAYYDDNTIYFSFAPNTSENQVFINKLLQMNNLANVKTLGFTTT